MQDNQFVNRNFVAFNFFESKLMLNPMGAGRDLRLLCDNSKMPR